MLLESLMYSVKAILEADPNIAQKVANGSVVIDVYDYDVESKLHDELLELQNSAMIKFVDFGGIGNYTGYDASEYFIKGTIQIHENVPLNRNNINNWTGLQLSQEVFGALMNRQFPVGSANALENLFKITVERLRQGQKNINPNSNDIVEYWVDFTIKGILPSQPVTSLFTGSYPTYTLISSSHTLHADVADNSFTSDFALLAGAAITATSSSYALSASYAPSTPCISASYALSSSYAPTIDYSLITGSSYPITASVAISASYAPSISPDSASYALTSSYCISASYAPTIDYSLVTGSTYPITSSWSNNTISASYALSASYAPVSTFSLTTGSSYPITSSWAEYSISASYAPGSSGTSLVTGSTYPITSSWSEQSISSSYALSASYAPGSSGTSLITGSTYPITSSWSEQSTTSSYLSGSVIGYGIDKIVSLTLAEYNALTPVATTLYVISSSTVDISASYALTASYALNGVSGGTSLTTGSSYPITSSWAEKTISASYAPSNISGTNGYVPIYSNNTLTPTSSLYITGKQVCIGTTSPDTLLTINAENSSNWNSGISLRDTTNNSQVFLNASLYSGAKPYMGCVSNDPFYFVTNNAYRFGVSAAGGFSVGNTYYNADPGTNNMIVEGNLAIGASGPAAKLEVNGAAVTTDAVKITGNNTSGRYALNIISPLGGGQECCRLENTNANGFAGFLLVNNVAASFASFGVIGNGYGDPYGNNFFFATDGNGGNQDMVFVARGSSTFGHLRYFTNGVTNERMRITAGGNVGIGTTNPGALLHVQGQISCSNLIGTASTASYAITSSYATTTNATTATTASYLAAVDVYPQNTGSMTLDGYIEITVAGEKRFLPYYKQP